MMKIILVDDEPLARARLRRMIENFPDYVIVGEADNGLDAIELCGKAQLDLVFMDIKMPVMDGLAAAKRINQLKMPPDIVFCTAYDDYALDAFDVDALGYLLKPVKQDKLSATLNKIQRMKIQKEQKTNEYYLSAKTHRGIERIALEDCRYFLADSKYVTVFHTGGELIVDETLKQLEERFASQLLRIHRNALVSKNHVKALEKQGDRFAVKLWDCDSQPLVSRRLLADVKSALGFE